MEPNRMFEMPLEGFDEFKKENSAFEKAVAEYNKKKFASKAEEVLQEFQKIAIKHGISPKRASEISKEFEWKNEKKWPCGFECETGMKMWRLGELLCAWKLF